MIPELVGADGQALQRSYFCLGLQSARKSDYPLAMPGERVTRFPDAKLFWFKRDQLRLQIAAGDGSFWIFDNLQPGIYGQPQGFKSYSQIQEWLTQECNLLVAYKTVHKIVRYKLNAKLKVPRPHSALIET